MPSMARNPSGTDRRLLAESSSVRSNHCVAEVISRIHSVAHHITGQGSDTLAAHRVALIGHSGRTDLVLFKGLLHFLQMLQQTNVVGHLVSAGRDACQNVAEPWLSTFLE